MKNEKQRVIPGNKKQDYHENTALGIFPGDGKILFLSADYADRHRCFYNKSPNLMLCHFEPPWRIPTVARFWGEKPFRKVEASWKGPSASLRSAQDDQMRALCRPGK